MKIRAVRVQDVRQFAGRRVGISGLSDGVSVLAAPNESGKSTIVEAMTAAFLKDRKSTASDVRAMMPHAGGSPAVWVDFEHKGKVWTLFKRFGRGAAAEVSDSNGLVAQGDAAEEWIAKEFPHAALAVDLLWARQGALAMEPEGSGPVEKRMREDGRAARKGLLSAAAAVLDSGLGGPRFDAVRARLVKELADLRTATGRPRTGGGLEKALTRRDGAAQARLQATARKERADAAVAARAQARAREAVCTQALVQAEQQASVAKEEVVNLRRAVEAARQAFAPLQGAQDGLVQARAHRDATVQAHARRDAAMEAQAKAEAALVAAQLASKKGEERIAQAVAHKASCEAALQAAQSDLEACTLMVSRVEAGAMLGQMARWRAVPVPAASVADCAAWEADVARHAALEGGDAGVVAEVLWEGPDRPKGWSVDGAHPLHDGDVLVVGDNRLVVRSVGMTARLEERSVLAQALAERVVRFGAQSPADLRALLRAAEEAAMRLSALQDSFDRLYAAVEPMDGDVDAAIVARDAAKDTVRKAQLASGMAGESLIGHQMSAQRADRDAAAARAAQDKAQAVLDTLPQDLVPLDAAEAALEAALSAAAEARAAAAVVEKRERALLSAEKALDTAGKAVDEARPARDRARESRADADGAARAAAEGEPQEAYQEAEEEWSTAQAAVGVWEEQAAALQMAIAALDEARSARSIDLFEPARVEMEPLVQAVFGASSTRFGSDSLLPEGLNRNGLSEDADVLSGGTRDALHILGRLAFAKVLEARGIVWPVVLDDSFAQMDEGRVARLGDLLQDQGMPQVLALSGRETSLLGWNGSTPMALQESSR